MLHSTMSSIGIARRIGTIDPANIEHILKSMLSSINKRKKMALYL